MEIGKAGINHEGLPEDSAGGCTVMAMEGRLENEYWQILVEEGDYDVSDLVSAVCNVCGEHRECERLDSSDPRKPTIYICVACSGGTD